MEEQEETENSPKSLSFSGSGYLCLYQIGAVKAMRVLAPETLKSAPKVYGASAGSLVAAAVVLKINLDKLQKAIYEAAIEARRTILGPFFPSFNLITILRKSLHNLLPENAHEMATGRLHIAVTRLSDGKNILISDYISKEEVIQVLICSCFVPLYCGFLPPSYRGVRYIDGGLTSFHPLYDKKSMISVSPFSGEIDICPRDCPTSHYCLHVCSASFQLSAQNLGRVIYSLFPPAPTVLHQFYYQGIKDAILYLNAVGIYKAHGSGISISATSQCKTDLKTKIHKGCHKNTVK
ncbi:omega-hydroxyceramide transacylase-like [Rhinophrynus dorsalis]